MIKQLFYIIILKKDEFTVFGGSGVGGHWRKTGGIGGKGGHVMNGPF